MTAEQTGIPCIGGPLDGQTWPADGGTPAVPIQKPFRWDVSDMDATQSQAPEVVQYKTFRMSNSKLGQAVTVFAPDDWTIEKVGLRLDEVAPTGFKKETP